MSKLQYQVPQTILDMVVSCHVDELDTSDIQLQKYKALIHCRHDLIHSMCCEMIGKVITFGANNLLREEFGDNLPEDFLRYSPDILVCDENRCILSDVSCTANKEFHYNEKKAKYQPIINYLREEFKLDISDFYLVWVDPNWSNLKEELENFQKYLTKCGFHYKLLTNLQIEKHKIVFESISEQIQLLSRLLPSEVLSERRIEYPKVEHPSTAKMIDIACRSNPLYELISNDIDKSSLIDVETLFEELVEDEQVFNYLKDTRHNESMFEDAFSELQEMEKRFPVSKTKPTLFVPFASFDSDIVRFLDNQVVNDSQGNKLVGLEKEQLSVLKFLNFLITSNAKLEEDLFRFLKSIQQSLKDCLSYEGELCLFNTGMITGEYNKESALNSEYKEFRNVTDSSVSKRTFFKEKLGDLVLKDNLPQIFRNKSIKVTAECYRNNKFVEKAGTSYRKINESRNYSEKKTLPKNEHEYVDSFLDLLYEKDPHPYKTHSFLGGMPGCDTETVLKMKQGMLEKQRKFLGSIQSRFAHSLSKHTSLIASQLLHFNELRTTDNTFCLVNSGRANCIHIIQGGSVKRGRDVGQAYFTIFLTDDKRWATKIYGELKTYEIFIERKKKYLCVTPWVRLTCERLSFMKDQYYSTLSTAYDSWSRIHGEAMSVEVFKHIYSFRVLVSLCPSQKVAELLMDTRYIFMSSLSTYSNVFKLILDKFAPPYKNCLEQHIVRQLRLKCKQCVLHLKKFPPEPRKPGYSGTKRISSTLGGKITIPSLWSDIILTDMQSIFDDIFVYVHTSKETTSEYHEQIKAMNTILKYQKVYDEMDTNAKAGIFTKENFKKWLLSGNQVGCHSQTVYHGTKLFSKKYEGLYRTAKFQNTCEREPISEIVSTKACIPEIERKVTVEERTNTQKQKMLKNLESLMKVTNKEPYLSKEINETFFKVEINIDEDEIEISPTRSLRVKVHDALIDWIGRFGRNSNYVIDLAYWNILNNDCKVLTDTCIKAQYGAKREFYVINLGAKGMARVTENSYKNLAYNVKNEMISIPGDKKLQYIQDAITEITLASERKQDKIYFVNGDCTKWSACETMSSFISMNEALSEVFGEHITNLNRCVFCSWSNKQIQVPQSILSSLKFNSESTEYINETTTIHSTQNFLQGMFNYSSSLKAVISTEFSIHMFKKLNPNKFLVCSHLEHSDDYSLSVRVKCEEDFEVFRVYHKLSQKLFGINDSEKKTNVQKHILEFISLYSFNGQLFYPHIKKTKEVGTNLSCTSYRGDVMSIGSRVSEACRYGVPLDSCYFMQRIHCCSVSDAYSTGPNSKRRRIPIDHFNTPLELFGLPDCLPIVYNLTKGNPDNFRIFNFSNEDSKEQIIKLYALNKLTENNSDIPSYNVDDNLNGFYSPIFKYPIRNNRLKAIKSKIGITFDEAMSYFNNNMSDCILKPVETKRFFMWLKSMYFNKSFAQAYTRASRSAMTLRHSLFSSKPCLISINAHLGTGPERYLDIYDYIDEFNHLPEYAGAKMVRTSKEFVSEINLHNDSLSIFYSFMDEMVAIECEHLPKNTTVIRMPSPGKWIQTENPTSNVLQYIINKDNFVNDRRTFMSDTSLYRDVKKIESEFSIELLRKDTQYCRGVIKRLNAQKQPSSYGIVFDTKDSTVQSYISQYINYGFSHNTTYNFVPKRNFKVKPFSKLQLPYFRDWKSSSDIYTETLSFLALTYRFIHLQSSGIERSNMFSNLLKRNILGLELDVKSFLESANSEILRTYGVGDLSIRCFCFLKAKLLDIYTDLHEYVKSNFFYEISYLSKSTCPEPFHEHVVIKFQRYKCRAYLHNQGGESTIIIEMSNFNKVGWFFLYTIAERAFNKINQQTLDLRFAHSYELRIPRLTDHQNFLLSSLKKPSQKQQFFRKIGDVIMQCGLDEANMPVIVSNVYIATNFAKRSLSGAIIDLNISDLQVMSSNSVVIFKLPFGNLPCRNTLEVKLGNDEDIVISGIKFSLLQVDRRLKNYLTNEYTDIYTPEEISENIVNLWENRNSKYILDSKQAISNLLDKDIFDSPYQVPEDSEIIQTKRGDYKQSIENKGMQFGIEPKPFGIPNLTLPFSENIEILYDDNSSKGMFIEDEGFYTEPGESTSYNKAAIEDKSNYNVDLSDLEVRLKMVKIEFARNNNIDINEIPSHKIKELLDECIEFYCKLDEENLPKIKENNETESLVNQTILDEQAIQCSDPVMSVRLGMEIDESVNLEESNKSQVFELDMFNFGGIDLSNLKESVKEGEEIDKNTMLSMFDFGNLGKIELPGQSEDSNSNHSKSNTQLDKYVKDIESNESDEVPREIGIQSQKNDQISFDFDALMAKSGEEIEILGEEINLDNLQMPKFDFGFEFNVEILDQSIKSSKSKSSKNGDSKQSSEEINLDELVMPNFDFGVGLNFETQQQGDPKVQFDFEKNKSELIGLNENDNEDIIPMSFGNIADEIEREDLLGMFEFNGIEIIEDNDGKFLYELNNFELGLKDVDENLEIFLEQIRSSKKIRTINWSEWDIEEEREALILGNVDEEDGALFDPEEQSEKSSYGSDSSQSYQSAKGDADHYQMVSQKALYQGLYHFELKCRKNMLPVVDYLMNLWFKDDIHNILDRSKNLRMFMQLLSFSHSDQGQVEFSKKQMAIQYIAFNLMNEEMSQNNKVYMIKHSAGLIHRGGKLRFVAVGGYENELLRQNALNRNPSLTPIMTVTERKENMFWAFTNLSKRDVDATIHITLDENDGFTGSSVMMNILDDMIPKIKFVQPDVIDSYGF